MSNAGAPPTPPSPPTPPTPSTALERLGPALQLQATYVGNLNNLLGFYLVIAGFLFAGYFQVISGNAPNTPLAMAVALLGVLVSIIFRLLDGRNRTIIDHVEGVIGELEADVYLTGRRPSGDIPKSPMVLGRKVGHVNLIRAIYWLLGLTFVAAMTFALCPGGQSAERKGDSSPANISISI